MITERMSIYRNPSGTFGTFELTVTSSQQQGLLAVITYCKTTNLVVLRLEFSCHLSVIRAIIAVAFGSSKAGVRSLSPLCCHTVLGKGKKCHKSESSTLFILNPLYFLEDESTLESDI